MDFLSTPLPKSSGTIENFVYDPWRVGTNWGMKLSKDQMEKLRKSRIKHRWQGKTIRQWMQVLGVSGDNEYRCIGYHLKTHGNLLEYGPYCILHGLPLAKIKQARSLRYRVVVNTIVNTPKGKMTYQEIKACFGFHPKTVRRRIKSDQHPDWSYAANQKKSKKERKTALIQTPKGKMMIHQAVELFGVTDVAICYRCDSSSEQMKGWSRLYGKAKEIA